MKLSARDAVAYFKAPDSAAAGCLLYGEDTMRVALRRKEVITALVGETAEEEMRLSRLAGAEVRKDPALLNDAMKSQSFFPGARAVHLEDATDSLTKAVAAALEDWQTGDAQIIVTAGQLTARSSLRKLFEGGKRTYAVGIYNDPPSRSEIESRLQASGLHSVSAEAMSAIVDLSKQIDPGDFAQTLEKLSLYMASTDEAVTIEDVQHCAPATSEADLDDLLHAVAEARAPEIGLLLNRLYAQGVTPVSLCIGATRHFRILHLAASDPSGPGNALGRARPPVFGPRRDRMARQAGRWGAARLERALGVLTDTDLTLRSSTRAPAAAVMERALIRLAIMGRGAG